MTPLIDLKCEVRISTSLETKRLETLYFSLGINIIFPLLYSSYIFIIKKNRATAFSRNLSPDIILYFIVPWDKMDYKSMNSKLLLFKSPASQILISHVHILNHN
jgi:hypothetical protein